MGGGMTSWTDRVTDTLHPPVKFFGDTMGVVPYMHRFSQYTGLAVGLYIGNKIMDTVCAQSLSGREIKKEDTPYLMRPLYGLMTYNRHSDEAKDHWKFVARGMMTASFGFAGAWVGSYNYFRTAEALKEDSKHFRVDDFREKFNLTELDIANATKGVFPEDGKKLEGIREFLIHNTLAKGETRANLAGWRTWRTPAAAIAQLGSASAPLGTEYTTFLGMAFLHGANKQVALPGVGRFATNSYNTLPDAVATQFADVTKILATNVEHLGDPQVRQRVEKAIVQRFKSVGKFVGPDFGSEFLTWLKGDTTAVAEVGQRKALAQQLPESLTTWFKQEIDAVQRLFTKEEKTTAIADLSKKLTGLGLNKTLAERIGDLSLFGMERMGMSGAFTNLMGKDLQAISHEPRQVMAVLKGLEQLEQSGDAGKQQAQHLWNFFTSGKSWADHNRGGMVR